MRHRGLYHPGFEHDSCGFGLYAHVRGEPSHHVIETALASLVRLTHRGAVAADGKSGDGCGLLLGWPEAFLRTVAKDAGLALPERFAVGCAFLPPAPEAAQQCRDALARACAQQDLDVIGWRVVPVEADACGDESRASLPRVEQCFVCPPASRLTDDLALRLYRARRQTECDLAAHPSFYLSTLSERVLCYKGLVMPGQLALLYPDLRDPRLQAPLCLFHQRFSTNTLPQWRLAQPFRQLAHNGEINTIRGNRNWVAARLPKLASKAIPRPQELPPIVSDADSDSCSLDNMLDFLLVSGLELSHALRLLIPPAWQNVGHMDPDLRAYYRFNGMKMESWDGPAGIVATDGVTAACILDRNGLRPARYVLTKDEFLTVGSEVGIHDYAQADVIAKGRLGPGEMIAVDTGSGQLRLPADIDRRLTARRPPRDWLTDSVRRLELRAGEQPLSLQPLESRRVGALQKLFLLTEKNVCISCNRWLRMRRKPSVPWR